MKAYRGVEGLSCTPYSHTAQTLSHTGRNSQFNHTVGGFSCLTKLLHRNSYSALLSRRRESSMRRNVFLSVTSLHCFSSQKEAGALFFALFGRKIRRFQNFSLTFGSDRISDGPCPVAWGASQASLGPREFGSGWNGRPRRQPEVLVGPRASIRAPRRSDRRIFVDNFVGHRFPLPNTWRGLSPSRDGSPNFFPRFIVKRLDRVCGLVRVWTQRRSFNQKEKKRKKLVTAGDLELGSVGVSQLLRSREKTSWGENQALGVESLVESLIFPNTGEMGPHSFCPRGSPPGMSLVRRGAGRAGRPGAPGRPSFHAPTGERTSHQEEFV